MDRSELKTFLLVFVVLFATTVSWAQTPQDAVRLFKQGEELEQKAKSLDDIKKAIQKYEQARSVLERMGDEKGESLCLNNLGGCYRSLGQYTKALEYFEESLKIRRKIGFARGEAVSLNNLGSVNYSLGRYHEALENFQKSLEIKRKFGDLQGEGPTLNNIAGVHAILGNYSEALELFEKSLEIAKGSGDIEREGMILINIASVYQSWSQYDKALDYLKKSLEINRSLGNIRNEGEILINVGEVYRLRGQHAKALEHYERSLKIRKKLGDVHGEGETLNNIGLVHNSLGEHAKALDYLEQALQISKEIGDIQGEGKTLGNFGFVYQSWGRYADALDYCQKSLEVTRKIADVRQEGVTLNNIGAIYQSMGRYTKALEFFEQSLVIVRNLGFVHGEAAGLNNVASVYKSSGNYAKALEYYEKSLPIMRKLGDVQGEGQVVWNIAELKTASGRYSEALTDLGKTLDLYSQVKVPVDGVKDSIGGVYLEMGDIAKAEQFLRDADYHSSVGRLALMKSDFSQARHRYEKLLKWAEEHRNADSLFTAYTGLGKVYESLEDYAKAEEYYEKGVQFLEEIRSSLLPSERRDFFNVKVNGFVRSDCGKGLTRVRMKLNRASGSIDSSELTRARAFSDNLFERSAAKSSTVPQQVLDNEGSVLDQVAALKKALAKTDREKEAARYESLSNEVKVSEADLKSLIEKLRKDYPSYAAVKYPRPVTLAESALHANEYVVMYDVSSEGVGVKLIHGKKIKQTLYNDWPQADLERDLKRFRESFETRKLGTFDPELGRALYRKLIGRVIEDVPPKKPIIVIPDGILAVLPFEALVTGGTVSWVKGKMGEQPEGLTYLGDEHPISYYQSITALTLARTMGSKSQPGNKLLVIADPVFHLRDDRAQVVRQDRVAGTEADHNISVMKAIEDDSGLKLANLPETGRMAEKLGEMFKPDTSVLTGLKANKADFLKDVVPKLDQYGRVVFATHGVFSTKIPGLKEPFLALTMVPPGTDGFLKMSDILSLKMNADIVALTACQTGLGKELSGEGVMSMGRAFQYAGARAVLMSLWEVQVDSALLIVESFFENLKAGKNKLDSLTAARDRVRSDGYAHPFYWAPFILVGEPN